MLKDNTSVLTPRASASWAARNNTAATIALTRTIPRKPRFNAIANMLRAHWTEHECPGPAESEISSS